MRALHVYVFACATAAAALAGCREADDRVPRAESPDARPEARQGANSTSWEADKQRAERALSEQLKTLDTRMEEMKAQARSANERAKGEWEVQRPKLEAQRAEAARKLDELRASSKEKWQELKPKAEAAFEELEQGFKGAWSKLKE